jgi:hypothetical protein
MLLYKGWLETRWRLAAALGWAAFGLIPWVPESDARRASTLSAIFALILAGAGIVTERSLRASKGLHGSTYFTLALPVSRVRLFSIRACLGWLEMTAAIGAWYFGIWILYPQAIARAAVTLESAALVVVGASALYSITLLLATFLEDQWRLWGSMAVVAGFLWFSDHSPFPASANIFRAMGDGLHLPGPAAPWTAIAFAVELTAILIFAAVKVVELREY